MANVQELQTAIGEMLVARRNAAYRKKDAGDPRNPWTTWKETKYHTRVHRGLKDAGEKWVTPIEMFENGPRYEKAAPPREYAAMLLMKADTARVYNPGRPGCDCRPADPPSGALHDFRRLLCPPQGQSPP